MPIPPTESCSTKCPYCLSEIDTAAKKCKHCGEWIEQTVKQSKPLCYWYSKVAAIANAATFFICLTLLIWMKQSISGNEAPLGIGMYISAIFAIGFWRYASTNDEWPFVFSSIATTISSVIGIIVLGFDGIWSFGIVVALIAGSAISLYMAQKASVQLNSNLLSTR